MDAEEFIRSIPPFTKYYLIAIFASTALSSIGIISAYSFLLYDFRLVYEHYQIWRLLTCFTFVGNFSFGFVFTLFYVHFGVSNFEKDMREKSHYDYYFFMVFACICAILFGWIYGDTSILYKEFVFAQIYVFAKRNPDMEVKIWGFKVTSGMFPWVLLGIHVLMG